MIRSLRNEPRHGFLSFPQVLSGEKEFENILFLRVEAENEADVSMEYEVAAVPTYLFFTRGKVVGRVEGAKVAEVTRMVSA